MRACFADKALVGPLHAPPTAYEYDASGNFVGSNHEPEGIYAESEDIPSM